MATTFTPLPMPGAFLSSAPIPHDLAGHGYREEEHVVSGRAVRYEAGDYFPEDGKVDARAGEEADFTTRVLVRRPDASGPLTVVVEWLNVSSGDDASPDFSYLAEEILRRGHAWVGISAQFIGVEGGQVLVPVEGELAARKPKGNGLKIHDPVRYADLDHPGDAWCYGIFTAVSRALTEPGGPLADLDVTARIAVGESQSGYALATYVNAVQPLTRAFDGFLVHSRGSASMPLGGSEPSIDLDEARHLPPVRLREDTDVPVITLETETDVLSRRFHFWKARQPDTDFLRTWELAGTAHADLWQIGEYESFLGCPDPVNRGQQVYVVRAALRALETWVAGGPAAPSAPPLEFSSADPPVFVTDAVGNAVGGLRTPCVEAPTQLLTGLAVPGSSVICGLFGRTLVADPAALGDLYADREDYLARYEAAVVAAVEAGFVLPEDADAVRAEAHPELLPG